MNVNETADTLSIMNNYEERGWAYIRASTWTRLTYITEHTLSSHKETVL